MRTKISNLWFYVLANACSEAWCYSESTEYGFKAPCQKIMNDLNWRVIVQLQNDQDSFPVREPSNSALHGAQFLMYNIDSANLTSNLLEIHQLMSPEINIVLTGKSSFIRDVLMKADRFDKKNQYITDYAHHSKWLICFNGNISQDLQSELAHLDNVVLINAANTEFNQVMTLRKHPSGNVFTPVSECGAEVSMCYFPNVKYGYNNRRIRVMTLETRRYVIKSLVNKSTIYSGYAMDILHHIVGELNLSYSISEPADGSWGISHNGSWDGIVAHLLNKSIDLAAIDLTITQERSDVIDYIYPPIHTDGISVLYKTLSPSPLFMIARPLHWEVYLALLGVTLAVIVTYHFIERIRIKQKPVSEMTAGIDPITRALVKQGMPEDPRTCAGKVLISFWWIFLMIVTGIYSANQAASFSSSKHLHPFTSYEEIAESDYELLNDIRGIATVNFLSFELPLIKRLRNRLYHKDAGLVNLPIKEKMRMIKEGKFALLSYLSTLNLYMADDCELDVIKENLLFEHMAFAVPKDSTLKADIEKIMASLQESGTLEVLWRKWHKERNSRTCVSEIRVQLISIEILAGSFIPLGCGFVLSLLVLSCEQLIHKYSLHNAAVGKRSNTWNGDENSSLST